MDMKYPCGAFVQIAFVMACFAAPVFCQHTHAQEMPDHKEHGAEEADSHMSGHQHTAGMNHAREI